MSLGVDGLGMNRDAREKVLEESEKSRVLSRECLREESRSYSILEPFL
jgi:hypothetical protein